MKLHINGVHSPDGTLDALHLHQELDLVSSVVMLLQDLPGASKQGSTAKKAKLLKGASITFSKVFHGTIN